MTAIGDPQSSGRERSTWWIYLVPIGVVVTLVITWWVLGLRKSPRAIGFGATPVTFTFTDTDMNEAMAIIRPGVPVRYEGATTGFVVTLKVREMKEQDAMQWIAELADQDITLADDTIVFADPSWLSTSHRAAEQWMLRTFGFGLWPNR